MHGMADAAAPKAFIHSCTLAPVEVLVKLLNAARRVCASITVVNVGDPLPRDFCAGHPDVEFLQWGPACLFEAPTLNLAREYGTVHPTAPILYLHTKGATSAMWAGTTDWVDMMLYWLTDTAAPGVCAARNEALATAWAVGCNFLDQPHPHFSGNFWWARGAHLASLPRLNTTPPVDKMASEWWVCSREVAPPGPVAGRYACLFDSHMRNHIHYRFPRALYAHAPEGAPLFRFVPGLDSMGGDFPAGVDVAARIADGTAVAYNTLGFVKHTLAAALEPSPYFGPRDGLYVRVASSLAHAW